MSPVLALTTFGSLLGTPSSSSRYFRANWHVVDEYAGIFQYVVIAAIAILLVVFVVKRLRERRNADV